MKQTMRYINLAQAHRRPIPENVLAAGMDEMEPDRRILKMLGARGNGVATKEGSILELVKESVFK